MDRFPERCGWQYGNGDRTIHGADETCNVCASEWTTNDAPAVAPCIQDRLTRRVNESEHDMRRLESSPGESPIRSGSSAFCARCDKVEWIRNGIAQPMGPCWPKHGMRFVMMMGVALTLAVAGLIAMEVLS